MDEFHYWKTMLLSRKVTTTTLMFKHFRSLTAYTLVGGVIVFWIVCPKSDYILSFLDLLIGHLKVKTFQMTQLT